MRDLLRPMLRHGAFLLVVFLLFLVVNIPADFVYRQVAQPNASLRLSDISGSIWSGHARYISVDRLTFEGLNWQLSPWALLTGRLGMDWQLDGATGKLQGSAMLDQSALQLDTMTGWLDMTLLSQQLRQQGIIVSGHLQLDINELAIEQGRLNALAGEIEWQRAGLVSPYGMKLGSYRAALSQQDGQVKAVVSDTGGALELAGVIELVDLRRYVYDLRLAVRDATVPGLVESFAVLGRPDEEGRVKLQGQGQLY